MMELLFIKLCGNLMLKYFLYFSSILIFLGELITEDNEELDNKIHITCTKYRLVGVVVHSGQASGGHYYSYILHR